MTPGSDTTSAFELAGDLDAERVAEIHRRTRSSCQAGRIPSQIDLSRVGQTDSSALALLLSWQEAARRNDRRIEFLAPPESLTVLADLSQVAPLLGWQAETDKDRSVEGQ
jgi:ABC-type transporter Mla MlaB component